MNIKSVLYLEGRLICLVSFFLMISSGVAFFYGEGNTGLVFIATALVSAVLGIFWIIRYQKTAEEAIGHKEAFLLVTLSWILISLIGAVPFYLTKAIPSFVDAFFESMSGFTTTGASILKNIEALDHALLFWRSLTQWIGGMGIIVMAIAILPQLSGGGLQMMKHETPGPDVEKLKPRIKETAASLWKIYFLLSVAAGLLFYFAGGMPVFDSICHAFTTMGTGGFSTKNASFGAFSSSAQMIATFFMFLAATNFVLHYNWVHGRFKPLFRNSEWHLYLVMILTCFSIIVLELVLRSHYSFLTAVRVSIFQVVSLGSSTGFITANFETWPHLSKFLLLLLMIVAGCAGSTAGGVKQVRILIFFKRIKRSLHRCIHPKTLKIIRMDGGEISKNALSNAINFLILYVLIFIICSGALMFFEIDVVTATSAAISCLSNIGPGFGQVGAVENFGFFNPAVKLILCACMLLGRLEFFTILVLFFPATWKK